MLAPETASSDRNSSFIISVLACSTRFYWGSTSRSTDLPLNVSISSVAIRRHICEKSNDSADSTLSAVTSSATIETILRPSIGKSQAGF